METVVDDSEFIGEPEHDEMEVVYNVRNHVIVCSPNEMYYINKLAKLYKRYRKDNPSSVYELDEIWEYIMKNLPFKKKYLTDKITDLFRDNLEAFS